MIVDCHTHLNRYDEGAPAALQDRYQALRADMQRHGIDHVLVLSSYKVNENRPSVQEILEVSETTRRSGWWRA